MLTEQAIQNCIPDDSEVVPVALPFVHYVLSCRVAADSYLKRNHLIIRKLHNFGIEFPNHEMETEFL